MTHDDELEDRLEEITQMAEANYNVDAGATIIGYLRDIHQDLSGEPAAFREGFDYAIHSATTVWLSNSGEVNCECARPFPEKVNTDGGAEWVCGDCGSFLAPDPPHEFK